MKSFLMHKKYVEGNLASERMMTKLMFYWENFQKVFFFMLSTSAELNIYMPIKTFNKICCLFAATQYPKKKIYIYTEMMIIM